MGKRKISELSIMDLILFLILSNIIAVSVPKNDQSFIYMMILIALLMAFQTIMTYASSKLPSIKYLFRGKPSAIILKGKLDFKEMLNRQYTLDSLLKQLHEKSIKNIEDAEYAILENDGELKTFGNNKNDHDIPLPVILDGQIQYVTLRILHKDDIWINKIISQYNVSLNNIFYAFYKQGRLYIIKNS
jgi:uncharacterized membrane protein YcaP (DUF421 family)